MESKYDLMSQRGYGSPGLLDKDHLNEPPTLDDLNQAPDSFQNTYWSQPLFRVCVVGASYLSFPYWCQLFAKFETTDPEEFNIVVGQIAPNVGEFLLFYIIFFSHVCVFVLIAWLFIFEFVRISFPCFSRSSIDNISSYASCYLIVNYL